ncbi:asparaginase [Lactobacillus sp. Sy-1]|uniref:asparaginase n=1 Tax=Lactobacillus sp. Sy-1 TaxID=2109645 RepID=UPI001C565B19|nr:asparaginase [Lactobacillus sp. Sy-1]MBW1605250.1 asparaginase [Lactobacillus sp. Sy-1]
MKTILAIHTGGTISMSADENGEVIPNQENPIASHDVTLDGQVKLINDPMFNLPSPHVTPEVMLQLRDRVLKAEKDGIDGVVITHGTDTLEETAYFLDLTLPNRLPVVLTGAMRSSNEIGSDGLYNLQSSVAVAASDDAIGKGVLVVMNDEIHTARYVTKTHTTNLATFKTPTFGPLGIISKHQPYFFQELIKSEAFNIDHVEPGVFLLKAFAGMDGTLFDALNNGATKGLVVEGLGSGNLPPATLPALKRILDRDIPVILVSRCYNGMAQDIYDYQGGGIELEQMGVSLCRGLNGPKARIKLIVGISNGLKGSRLAQYMSTAIS